MNNNLHCPYSVHIVHRKKIFRPVNPCQMQYGDMGNEVHKYYPICTATHLADTSVPGLPFPSVKTDFSLIGIK